MKQQLREKQQTPLCGRSFSPHIITACLSEPFTDGLLTVHESWFCSGSVHTRTWHLNVNPDRNYETCGVKATKVTSAEHFSTVPVKGLHITLDTRKLTRSESFSSATMCHNVQPPCPQLGSVWASLSKIRSEHTWGRHSLSGQTVLLLHVRVLDIRAWHAVVQL